MRALFAYERRLQDLEHRLANTVRYVDVKDVKHENGRWYIKGEDGSGDNTTFKSDWLPWTSFSHGSIKISAPPRKGMKARIVSPNGEPEMGSAEPFHSSNDAKSPHDKQDEYVMTIEGEDGKDSIRIHYAKDHQTVTIGNTTFNITKDGVTTKTKNYTVECDNYAVTAKAVQFKKG